MNVHEQISEGIEHMDHAWVAFQLLGTSLSFVAQRVVFCGHDQARSCFGTVTVGPQI